MNPFVNMAMHAALLLSSAALAAVPPAVSDGEIELFPGGAPGEVAGWPGPEVHVPLPFSPTYTGLIVYNVSRPALVPHVVRNGSGGAVVVAPGGGYTSLAWHKEGADVARRLNEMGVSAFVLRYRVPLRPSNAARPYAWAALQDAQRAVRLVRHRAADFGINASRVGFLGFSAGGHLAAHLCATGGGAAYRRRDAADDLPFRPDVALLLYPWRLLRGDDPHATALAPELNVTAEHPHAFVAVSEDDDTAFVENALRYYSALRDASAPASALHVYPKGGHGFGLCQNFPGEVSPRFEECCDWPLAALRFLQDHRIAPGWPRAPAPP